MPRPIGVLDYEILERARRRSALPGEGVGFTMGEREFYAPEPTPRAQRGRGRWRSRHMMGVGMPPDAPAGSNIGPMGERDVQEFMGPLYGPSRRREMPGPWDLERLTLEEAQPAEKPGRRALRTFLTALATSPQYALGVLDAEEQRRASTLAKAEASRAQSGEQFRRELLAQQRRDEERAYQETKEGRTAARSQQEKIWQQEADLAEKYGDPSLLSPDNPYGAGIEEALRGLRVPAGYEFVPGKGVMQSGEEKGLPTAWQVERRVGDLGTRLQRVKGEAARARIWKREAEDQMATHDPMIDAMRGLPLMSPDNPLRPAVEKALKGRLGQPGEGSSRPMDLDAYGENIRALELEAQEIETSLSRARKFPRRGRGLPMPQEEPEPEEELQPPPPPRPHETARAYHARLEAMGYSERQADDAVIDYGLF